MRNVCLGLCSSENDHNSTEMTPLLRVRVDCRFISCQRTTCEQHLTRLLLRPTVDRSEKVLGWLLVSPLNSFPSLTQERKRHGSSNFTEIKLNFIKSVYRSSTDAVGSNGEWYTHLCVPSCGWFFFWPNEWQNNVSMSISGIFIYGKSTVMHGKHTRVDRPPTHT